MYQSLKSLNYLRKKVAVITYRQWSNRWRCLPDYLLIGAQKSGTTSLYKYLVSHPEVHRCLRKEVGYFDDQNFNRGLAWYLAHFPIKSSAGFQQVTGEATPRYYYSPQVPQRVHSVVPQAKLIILLRNPVERAHSHYWHLFNTGREQRPFAKAVEDELRLLSTDSHLMKIGFSGSPGYVARGMYSRHLRRWLSLFPERNLRVLISEDFFSKPAVGYNEITDFLQVRRHLPKTFKVYNSAAYKTPMPDRTREMLIEFYHGVNMELSNLLGRRVPWP